MFKKVNKKHLLLALVIDNIYCIMKLLEKTTHFWVCQSVDDISQGEKGAIDIGALSKPSSFGIGGAGSLWAGEVNQTHFGDTDVGIEAGSFVLLP